MSNETLATLETARAEYEAATINRALAYAEPGHPTEVGTRSAAAARRASAARRDLDRAILAHAAVTDPGLSRLP
jgi:hypothetical protein